MERGDVPPSREGKKKCSTRIKRKSQMRKERKVVTDTIIPPNERL